MGPWFRSDPGGSLFPVPLGGRRAGHPRPDSDRPEFAHQCRVSQDRVVAATMTIFVNKVHSAESVDIRMATTPWTEAGPNGATFQNALQPSGIFPGGVPVSSAEMLAPVDISSLCLRGLPQTRSLLLLR